MLFVLSCEGDEVDLDGRVLRIVTASKDIYSAGRRMRRDLDDDKQSQDQKDKFDE